MYKASESPFNTFAVIPTGLSKLDTILGTGGIPLRKITEISGKWSVGKSTLALMVVESAQHHGYKTLWVDTEYSFDEKYASSLGVNCDELDLIQEPYAEAFLDATEEWARTHKKGLIVLDSVGGLLPKEEAEKGAEGRVIGGQAKLIAAFVRRMVPTIAVQNHALLVLNHELIDIMSGNLKTSGGAKLEFHRSLWLSMRKAGKRVMKGEDQIGEMIYSEVKKNKLAGTVKQSCEITMIYGKGFSKEADLLDQLIASGEVTKKGNTFYRGEVKLGVGLNAAREALKTI